MYCSCNITYDIAIILLDKDVRELAVSRLAQRNSGHNAKGAGDRRNKINTTINPPPGNTQQYPYPDGGG